ncbi:MAG TPA: glycosyltransferase family 2 protein [Candidatus Paceibacterota bacterium]
MRTAKHQINPSYPNVTERVAAIVPAFNEGLRISAILQVLTQSLLLSEIVVVDDGSTDNTETVVRKFPSVKYIKNDTNRGKGFSVDRGVALTSAPIVFFCDADLENLTQDIVSSIIGPVIRQEFDMFVGVRGNFAQRSWRFVALNSGERALRREIWEQLPSWYKVGWRIEPGLNNFVSLTGRKMGYRVFPYRTPAQEKKRGLLLGTVNRVKLSTGLVLSYFRFMLIDRPILKKLTSKHLLNGNN